MILEFGTKHNEIEYALSLLPGIKVKKRVHVNELRNKPINELSAVERKIIK
jgi:hypothetical protein